MSWFAQTCFTWPGGGEGRRGTEWLGVACFNQPGLLVELELLVLTLFNDASSSSVRIAQHFYGLQFNFSILTVCIIFTIYLLILILFCGREGRFTPHWHWSYQLVINTKQLGLWVVVRPLFINFKLAHFKWWNILHVSIWQGQTKKKRKTTKILTRMMSDQKFVDPYQVSKHTAL